MPDTTISIKVIGLDKIIAAFDQFPREIWKNMKQAGHESAMRVILPTEGLQKYPPGGPGAPQAQNWTDKQRRYFFWALNAGIIEVPYRRGQSPNSERLGTQWHARQTDLSMTLGNRASYAPYLHGRESQSPYMANRGWRKLWDVAQEKVKDIGKVYQAWVNKTIKDLGL